MSMAKTELFLGVDGGGTRSRARLCDASGHKLAEAQAGPANIRFGLKDAFASVRDVSTEVAAVEMEHPRASYDTSVIVADAPVPSRCTRSVTSSPQVGLMWCTCAA